MREKRQRLSTKALPDKDTASRKFLSGRVRRSRTKLAGKRWFERNEIKREYIRFADCQILISILDIIPGIVNLVRRSHHLIKW